MKVLVLSNLYPPLSIGGYEAGCRDATEGLIEAGHNVRVLTGTFKVDRPMDDGRVSRRLRITPFYGIMGMRRHLYALRDNIVDQRVLAAQVRSFRPDVVYVWGPLFLPASLLYQLNKMGVPVCYYVFDEWPAKLHVDDLANYVLNSRFESTWKRMLTVVYRLALKAAGAVKPTGDLHLTNVQYANRHLQRVTHDAGFRPDREWVIPWGIDTERYKQVGGGWPARRLLFAGRLTPEKGAHTAIEAFAKVLQVYPDARLTLAGGTMNPPYEAELKELTRRLGLEATVRFAGHQAPEQMPAVYAEHDVLIFPSTWAEPFGLARIEGMLVGLPVVGTATGGGAEIALDGENMLVFRPGDADDCAEKLIRIMGDRQLYESIRANGIAYVREHFSIRRAQADVERSLLSIVEAEHAAPAR